MATRKVDAFSRTVTMAHGSARAFNRRQRGEHAFSARAVTVPEFAGLAARDHALGTGGRGRPSLRDMRHDGPISRGGFSFN